eukprot:IDg14073t1
MKLMSGDPALHFKVDNSKTNDIIGFYVEDSTFAVVPGFESAVDPIIHEFDSKSLEWDNIDFVRIRVGTRVSGDASLHLGFHQPEYLEKLLEMLNNVSFERFRSVTSASFVSQHVKYLEKDIRYASSYLQDSRRMHIASSRLCRLFFRY